VIAKNGQRLSGDGAGRNVKHGGREFPGDLVHIGEHEQQPLRRGKRGRQGARLQGAMDGARSTRFTLHFHHGRDRSPNIRGGCR